TQNPPRRSDAAMRRQVGQFFSVGKSGSVASWYAGNVKRAPMRGACGRSVRNKIISPQDPGNRTISVQLPSAYRRDKPPGKQAPTVSDDSDPFCQRGGPNPIIQAIAGPPQRIKCCGPDGKGCFSADERIDSRSLPNSSGTAFVSYYISRKEHCRPYKE